MLFHDFFSPRFFLWRNREPPLCECSLFARKRFCKYKRPDQHSQGPLSVFRSFNFRPCLSSSIFFPICDSLHFASGSRIFNSQRLEFEVSAEGSPSFSSIAIFLVRVFVFSFSILMLFPVSRLSSESVAPLFSSSPSRGIWPFAF